MSTWHARAGRHGTGLSRQGLLTWSLSVVAALPVFYLFLFYFMGTTALSDIDTYDPTIPKGQEFRPPPPPVDAAGGRPLNILLMGSDVRTGANGAMAGVVDGMRNDTTLLLHVSADRTRLDFVSFPRDLQVKLAACPLDDGTVIKGWTGDFNFAFANGGTNGSAGNAAYCTMLTVESITGIYIDEFAVIDFYGFQQVIDTLGGVPMCIPGRIVSGKAQLDLQPGPQILNGQQALGWARLRTAEVGKEWVDGSDLTRIDRQHELMSKLVEQVLAADLLLHPGDFANVAESMADSLTTSPNLADFNFLKGLAWSVRHIDKANIVFTTVPNKYTPDFLNVVMLPAAQDVFAALRLDQPIAGATVADRSDAAPVPQPSASGGADGEPGGDDGVDLVGACAVGA